MLNYIFTQTPLSWLVQNFWRDEAFTYLLANKNIFEILRLTAQDFNPPLYYLLMHFWIQMFGSSEIGMRIISIAFFWATFWIVFLFFKNVFKFSNKKIILYSVFFLLNPLFHYYAFEARMYSMFAFFATASFYCYYTKNKKWYTVVTVLGLYTHYFMLLVLLAQGIWLFVEHRLKPKRTDIQQLIVPFLFLLPWLIFSLVTKRAGEGVFWILPMTWEGFITIPSRLYTGYEGTFKFYDKPLLNLSMFISLLVIVGSIFTFRNHHKLKKEWLFFFLWGIGAALIVGLVSFFVPLFLPRYLIFAGVGFFLFLVFCLERMPLPLRFIFLAALFLATFHYQSLQVKHRTKANYSRMIREIKNQTRPNDVIYVTDELDYFPAQYYFDQKKVYIYQKDYSQIRDYVGKVLIPKEALVHTLPYYPKRAFVITPWRTYSIQALY